MIGDEYIDDKNRIYVTIVYFLNYSVTNINFKTELDNNPIAGGWGQNTDSFIIKYERKISEKLFNNLTKGVNNSDKNLIFGYFNAILPKINEEIFKLKYLSGHILCRPVSKFDVSQTVIIKNTTNEHVNIGGAYKIDNSTLPLSLKEENNHIFIRDYIDAMTSFLFNNYYNGGTVSSFDSLYFGNCIFDGSLPEEFNFDVNSSGFIYPYLFDHCALKTQMSDLVNAGPHASSPVIINPPYNPMKFNNTSNYDFSIPLNSPSGNSAALGAGNPSAMGGYYYDITNTLRSTSSPDLGAYVIK